MKPALFVRKKGMSVGLPQLEAEAMEAEVDAEAIEWKRKQKQKRIKILIASATLVLCDKPRAGWLTFKTIKIQIYLIDFTGQKQKDAR